MYVRFVKQSVWVRLIEQGEVAIGDAVAELTRSGTDVSVYDCSSRAALELVGVALTASMSRKPFRYIEIGPEDLAGIEVKRVEGITCLPDANQLHRDLDLSDDRARILVQRLLERRVQVGSISESALRGAAKRLHDAGQPIPPESWLLR